jgi:hypothetical protein
MFRTVAVVIAAFYLTANPLAAGQQGRSVNPEAIEFEAQPIDRPDLTQYRVEFFKSPADPRFDFPFKSIEVDTAMQRDDGILRVDLDTVLEGLPDGEYVARLRAMGETGPLDVRAPLEFFLLTRQADLQEQTDLNSRERFWTKVGFAIMGALLLVPFLAR